MNLAETAGLLTLVTAYDRRTLGETDVRSWHEILGHAGLSELTFEDAKAAVLTHYAATRDWLMPSDVITYCRRLRAERLRGVNVQALVTADPSDISAWHAELQQIRADIMSGRRPATTPQQIGGGS